MSRTVPVTSVPLRRSNRERRPPVRFGDWTKQRKCQLRVEICAGEIVVVAVRMCMVVPCSLIDRLIVAAARSRLVTI